MLATPHRDEYVQDVWQHTINKQSVVENPQNDKTLKQQTSTNLVLNLIGTVCTINYVGNICCNRNAKTT
jgi:hypothetical protein